MPVRNSLLHDHSISLKGTLSQIKTKDTHNNILESQRTNLTKMPQSTNTAILLAPPAGAESNFPDDNTLDQDVFDGIEDIYTDLESNPPPVPPSSKEEIILHSQQQRVNNLALSSSESTESDESSIGINKNNAKQEKSKPIDNREIPYLCGVVPKNSSTLENLWNSLTNSQNYYEIKETDNQNQPQQPKSNRVMGTVFAPNNFCVETQPVPTTTSGVIASNPAQAHDVEMKTKIFTETNNVPNAKTDDVATDIIIHHAIDEVEDRQPKKGHTTIVDLFAQKNPFVKGTIVEDKTNGNTKNVYQTVMQNLRVKRQFGGDDDDEAIRRKKMKKYEPSFWSVLGQRKLFGVSHRLLLLVAINLFCLMLLVILITQFTGRKENEAGSLDTNAQISSSSSGTDADLIENDEPEPIDTNTDDNGVGSELRALCEEEGVTREDGVILTGNQVFEKGEYFCSPSKTYIIGMMDDLAIVDINANQVIWSAGVTEGARTILLDDGSMFIENEAGDVLWNAGEIPDNRDDLFFNPQLVFWENSEGLIALQQSSTTGGVSQPPYSFWMEGRPEFELTTNGDLQFPVRGTFYFPTFDNSGIAWQNMDGEPPMHYPSMGFYSSSDPIVITSHVEAMEYGNIDLGISFWLGPETNFDRSRITMLLDETNKQNSNLKWTVSYEVEQRRGAVSPEEIQSDLEYLKRWFAGHGSWARIDGKPVIFVNNKSGCYASDRWMSGAASDWYVVMKIFGGYERCEYQADSWYDNRINDNNDGIDVREGLYHNLAPGHWRIGRRRPDLERLSPGEWCANVRDMDESTEQWHLITSFNDANRGTSIEPSLDWRSGSRYGFFLDCLNDPEMF